MCKQSQLIEFMIQDIVNMLTTDQNIEYDEAMNKFYNSEVFEKLQDIETGLYLESPEYVYDLFKDDNTISAYGLLPSGSLPWQRLWDLCACVSDSAVR